MEPKQLKELIEQQLPGAQVKADGDGSHFLLEIVSDQFEGLSKLKRHQLVYACVNERIANGDIHALTIQAHTPAEQQQ